MSIELALKALIAEIVREIHEATPKRGPGRPAKGESPAPAAGSPAAPPAPAASSATTGPANAPGTALAAAPTAAAGTPNLTHAAVAPSFLAAAKAHGREFVVWVMKELGVPGDPPTFDKVPAELLAKAKAMLEGGPKAKAPAADGSDLLG
jgi:hypothetical protein